MAVAPAAAPPVDPRPTQAPRPPGARGEVELVRSALRDIGPHSKLRLVAGLRDKWFPTAFNHWYCPALRRGYSGGMAPVFDIGVTLLEPSAELRDLTDYGAMLQWIRERPFIGELARRALPVGRGEHEGLVTWTIVEPLLRCLSGVWDSASVASRTGHELPNLERRLDTFRVFASAYAAEPLETVNIAALATSLTAKGGSVPVEQVRCVLPNEAALAARLFAAHIARVIPELAHKLDHELVDACLLGPVLGEREHEPPRRTPSDVATSRMSKQPGAIAGVTRVEIRRPGDPITDVLPSELMILRKSREVGLANILYGRPLVVVHEREWDVVPKHRALVCYVVDAHQARSGSSSALRPSKHGSDCAYRASYVYAKRQVLDTLYDLSDAQALARHSAEVQIDAALFAIAPGRESATVHHRIPLEALTRVTPGGGTIGRLREMLTIAERVPAYFVRYGSGLDRLRLPAAGRGDDVLPNDVARYLRSAAQHGRYRTIHLVLVDVDNPSRLLERVYRHLHFQSATPVRITLIGIKLAEKDPDVRLAALGEPAWTYLESGSLRDGLALDLELQTQMPLAELRAKFVGSIFGKEAEPTPAQLSRIRLE